MSADMLTTDLPTIIFELKQKIMVEGSLAEKKAVLAYKDVIAVGETTAEINKFVPIEIPGPTQERKEDQLLNSTKYGEGYPSVCQIKEYGFKIALSKRMLKFSAGNPSLPKQVAEILHNSDLITWNYEGIGPLSFGFDSAYAGGDGQPYFSAAHLRKFSGNYDNLLTAETFSRSAAEAQTIEMAQATGDKGVPMGKMPEQLIHGTTNIFAVPELLESEKQPETGNNAKNVITRYGIRQVFSPYIASAEDYFYDCGAETRKMLVAQKPELNSYSPQGTDGLASEITSMLGTFFYNVAFTFGCAGS